MQRFIALAICVSAVLVGGNAYAQQAAPKRLPTEAIDVTPPSQRVTGPPAAMQLRSVACRTLPLAQVRRRIVNIAAQEWAFFGFPVLESRDDIDENLVRQADIAAGPGRRGGRWPPLPLDEATRVASSVGGYWATTPLGPSMISNQNKEWSGPDGINGRWADPWSAAFISWVMCEAGLGNAAQFQRSIAHWNYIDQAIAARAGRAPGTAYVAYDIGEEKILPGDMLCSGRRPAYNSLAERRRQAGVGARTHCDIVVQVDEQKQRILTIGGNVRRAVSVKLFPAARDARGNWQPLNAVTERGTRPLFAHLKLRAEPVEATALQNSPTITMQGCERKLSERRVVLNTFPKVLAGGSC